ncbi:hypothetical protein [Halobacterium bonnevillei]|uniref:Uncharacterized protein n=1 Tax=Halobacterium bonnevillei TaxID=2692200 RepID=A0A6B0SCP3_9EURY|nr:hypothetical protein [Halobacterium bonnevillei]
MSPVKHLYNRVDTWLRELPPGAYAVFYGAAGGVGVLLVGLLLSQELLVVQALMMALVLFSLELVFGINQPTTED